MCKVTRESIKDSDINIKRVENRLFEIAESIKINNKNNLTDINVICEEIFGQILNKLYDINLVSMSAEVSGNFIAVDLVDYKKRIAYQVTSRCDRNKIERTVQKFNDSELYNDIDELRFLILNSVEHNYNGADIIHLKSGKEFSYTKDIMNFNKLIGEIEKKNEIENNFIVDVYDCISMVYDSGRLKYFSIVKETESLLENNKGIMIDYLYIDEAHNLFTNDKLLNLIGRVNRLNDVFDKEVGTLDKLLPTVHFINSKYYRGNMQNKIKNLYNEETDEVTNPLLLNCNVDSLKYSFDKKEKIKNKNNEILELEHIYSEETTDEITILKKKLMKNGMDQLISLKTENVSKILNRIKNYDLKQNMDKDVIDKVKELLVVDLEIIDKSFKRLKNDAAVRYYKRFINVSRRDNLSGQIESQLEFFKVQRKNGNNYMYIGQGFGECKGPYLSETNMGDVYIDLRTKTDEELVNLLIIKTKIEQDFLSYQYLRAVSFLRDVKIISKDEFNIEIYGTADETKIDLLKLGITAGLLKILNSENQIKNIEKDQYGNIQGNAELKRFYMTSDDYTKFEIEKYIRIN